jgi:hypothetical protein
MMCSSRRKVGWGLFGPCKPRVLANGFNSSDIVCDSATGSEWTVWDDSHPL